MSERVQISTQVEVRQNSSVFIGLLAEVLSTSVEAVAEAIASIFDLSAPAYSAQELLKGVVESARSFSAKELEVLSQQLPSLSPTQLEPLAKAQGLLEAIEGNPLLRLGVSSPRGSEFREAQQLLLGARHQLQTGTVTESLKSARQAQKLLVTSLKTLNDRLLEAQHRFVVQAATESLRSLGYQLRAVREDGWTAIWAEKGAHGIALTVSPESDLHIDMLGWEWTACQGELSALLRAMRERGVAFPRGRRFHHGRRGGGALLQEALKIARKERVPIPQALLRVVRASQPSSRQLLAALLQQQVSQGGRR